MKLTMRCALSVMLAITLSIASYSQESDKKPESWSATAIGTGGVVGGRSISFNLVINGYTTDQEVQNFAALLREKGQDALLSALQKEDKGRISPTGHVGNEIAIARKRQQGKETIITIVTARTMSFVELYRSGRTVDYPFGFMRVKLNEKGQGTGQVMAAASIRFNQKSGKYEIESFGNQYIKLANVFPWK